LRFEIGLRLYWKSYSKSLKVLGLKVPDMLLALSNEMMEFGCEEMSPNGHKAADHSLIADWRFRGEADMHGREASTAQVVDDPERPRADVYFRSQSPSIGRRRFKPLLDL